MSTMFIAHRGYGLINMENTLEAFLYAGRSTCFGIETDVHATKDNKYVVFHDDNLVRLCGVDLIVENATLSEIQNHQIFDTFKHEKVNIPTLEEYLDICIKYNKYAVIELKNPLKINHIKNIVSIIENKNFLNETCFISFNLKNLKQVKILNPKIKTQFITNTYSVETIKLLAKLNIDLDIEYTCLSTERIKQCHEFGVKVNCWTLNDEKIAKEFCNANIDYITSNSLEKV